jgi:xanthine/uracil permease
MKETVCMFRYLIAVSAVFQLLLGIITQVSGNAADVPVQNLAGAGLVSLSLIPLAILAAGRK